MKSLKHRQLTFLLFLIVILLIPNSCKRTGGEFEIYRFIDQTQKENVFASPLIGLVDEFKNVEQKFSQDDFFLLRLEENRQKFWATSLQLPILGLDKTGKPEGMAVFRGDQEIPFAAHAKPGSSVWTWRTMAITIHPEFYRSYSQFRFQNMLNLPKNKYFTSFPILLSEGEVEFNVLAASLADRDYYPHMDFYLNDELVGTQIVKQRKNYTFVLNVPSGWHKLKVGFRESTNFSTKKGEEKLVVDQIRVKCKNDLFMIAQEGKNRKKPEEQYRATYRTSAEDHLLYPLYTIQKSSPLFDRGAGPDPYSLKKKIKINNKRINALFAPPTSVFTYELSIPESGMLAFGCGLMEEAWKKQGDGVRFQIVIEDEGKIQEIFSKKMNPFREHKDRIIFRHRIDLNPYANKKIKISFRTKKNNSQQNDFAVWCNPTIYPAKLKEDVPEDRTNVILISLDTLRADHLGCYGYSKDTSPNIDKFAQESVLFEDVHSHSPSTLPSHMSMLTSLYPTDHGAYAHAWGAEFRLDPSIVTLADLMREASYVSGAITGGAWVSGKFGFAKGFDIYTDNAMYKDDYPENVFGQVKNWIKNNSHHQFFLFLHSYEIHSPYAPPPPYTNMFAEGPLKWTSVIETEFILNRRGQNPLLNEQEKENFIALYDGEIRYTDERLIKPIIEELKRLKLYDSTMIILTSDHGEEFLEHGGLGHTRVLYEESLRVPLIIKFPQSGHRGTRVPNAVRVVDILPSILDILGLDYSSFQFEGQSVLGLLKSGAKDSRISVGYKFAPLYTEQHQFGYILRYISENMDGSKLIWKEEIQRRNKIPPGIELYDLLKDPGEKNNLAESELSLAQELIEKLNPYYREASKIKEGVIKTVVEDKSLEERLRALGYIK